MENPQEVEKVVVPEVPKREKSREYFKYLFDQLSDEARKAFGFITVKGNPREFNWDATWLTSAMYLAEQAIKQREGQTEAPTPEEKKGRKKQRWQNRKNQSKKS
jgi:hypothetical protein